MSKVLKRRWQSDLGGSGLPRRDRVPCDYEAYVPGPLMGRKIVLDGDVAADVADAEAAIAKLNAEARALVDTEALARILLRAEAVALSRIEGLEVGARRLLHAEVVKGLKEVSSDVTATEVLRNIDAMVYGIDAIGPGDPITVDVLLEVHRRLLSGTRLEAYGGQFRDEQNWIGEATTTRALPTSSLPPLSSSKTSWQTSAPSPAPTTSLRLRKQPLPMLSSNRSTPLWMATAEREEHSSISSFAGEDWPSGFCPLCRSCLPRGRRATSMDSRSIGLSDRRLHQSPSKG